MRKSFYFVAALAAVCYSKASTSVAKAASAYQKASFLGEILKTKKLTYGSKEYDVIDISYNEIVNYVTSHWEEFSQRLSKLDNLEKQDILNKMRIICLDTDRFKKEVIPEDENSATYFRIDSDYLIKTLVSKDKKEKEEEKEVKKKFIKDILTALIDNPVGEARIKSLMLMYCLSKVKMVTDAPFDSFYKVRIPTVDLDDLAERSGYWVQESDIFWTLVKCFVRGTDCTLSVQQKGGRVREIRDLSTDWRSLKEFTQDELNCIVIGYIHEISHFYHARLGLLEGCGKKQPQTLMIYSDPDRSIERENVEYDILQYCVPLLREDVRRVLEEKLSSKCGELGGRLVVEKLVEDQKKGKCSGVYSKESGFWSSSEEMMTILGFGLYPSGDGRVCIVEDRINENAAKRYCKTLPFRIGHHRGCRDDDVEAAMNESGYRDLLIDYYEQRSVDKDYISRCNESLGNAVSNELKMLSLMN